MGLNMATNHIDKVAIDLYAAGYKYLPKETARLIGKHLSECDSCSRQLLLALNCYDAEQNRARRAMEIAKGMYLGTSSTASAGAQELLNRFLDVPVGAAMDRALASGHVERLTGELAALEDVKDIGFCIRTIFAASESLGWEVWFLLGPRSLADRLAMESDIGSACFCIRQMYLANREAGRKLLESMNFRQLIDRAMDSRKSADLLQCVSSILEAEENSGKSLGNLLMDGLSDRLQYEMEQICRVLNGKSGESRLFP